MRCLAANRHRGVPTARLRAAASHNQLTQEQETMTRFQLTPAQWKSSWIISTVTSFGLLVISGILAGVASDDGANVLIAIALGLSVGTLGRSFAIRGWRYATDGRPAAAFTWTARRRLGIAWRVVGLFFAGQALINFLDHLAWSDGSQLALMLIALLVITEATALVGLRFGWNEAQAPAIGEGVEGR